MVNREADLEREARIQDEIVVDAYGAEERAMGWYCYLEGQLEFPFIASCVTKRAISPLQIGDEVDVVGMAGEEECQREIFVTMPWQRDSLAVPLMQLKVVDASEQTEEAVADWHYWVERGYLF